MKLPFRNVPEPGLFHPFKPGSQERPNESLELQLSTPPLLAAYHPATLHAGEQLEEV